MKLESVSQLYSIFLKNPAVCIDSRSCVPGSLFFALKGSSFNANAFAAAALEKGCSYAVIDDPQYEDGGRFILVDDVLSVLQRLAAFHRRQLAVPVIGITGTNGKTTTKELLAAVLKEKYSILYTQGNFNNHIGVPLTLLRLQPQHELAVVEMGASHPGEIKELCEMARPDYGIITNVGKGHLEGFGSFEGVVKTKSELYRYISEKGKLAFVNTGSSILCQMARDAGLLERNRKTAGYRIGDCSGGIAGGEVVSSAPFLQMNCTADGSSFQLNTNLIGAYNAENILAAVAAGSFFNISNTQIKVAIESYHPSNYRSQLVETADNKLIVDAYNANPVSMAAAINNFIEIDAEDKLFILGDMLELGEQSGQEHQDIVELLQASGQHSVLLVGGEFAKAEHSYPVFQNVHELIKHLDKKKYKNKYILIKGSRSMKLEQAAAKL